jgi:type III restriction enzyme
VAQHPKLIDRPHEASAKDLVRHACKMATGSGKTVVMAMVIAWAFCNRGARPGDPRYPRRVLVVCPNLTIRERLAVLSWSDPGNYYEKFDLVPANLREDLAKGQVLVTNWHLFNETPEEQKVGGVAIKRLGQETPEAFARNRLGDLWDDEPLLVLNDEGHHAYRPAPVPDDADLTADERADREEATVWVAGLDRIQAACGIAFCVDLSATPFYIKGSGYPEGSPFPWIVSDFSLVDAIESGITKIPRLPAMDNTGRPDPKYFHLWDHITRDLKAGERFTGGKPKPEVVYRKAEDALLTLAGEWRERHEQILGAAPGQDRTPPVLIIVCDNTQIAQEFFRVISGESLVKRKNEADEDDLEDEEDHGKARRKKRSKHIKAYSAGLKGFAEFWNRPGVDVTIRIDTELLSQAESDKVDATRKEAAEALRRVVSTVGRLGEPGEKVRCVISVNMLSEGWDANNVTHILGLRAFRSQLLCEQVVGRGLRRMDYEPDPATGLLTPEYVDIFGVPFSLIPFKGRQPGTGAPQEDRPRHEVLALPERATFEIRFPNVEGYVVDLRRHVIRCDVDRVETTTLDPNRMVKEAFVRPQVGYQVGYPGQYGGFGFEGRDRHAYYGSMHPQTIAFEIARGIVYQLTTSSSDGSKACSRIGRAALFPQVLNIVEQYLARRVRYNGMHPCEVGLEEYVLGITSLLVAAIEPDESAGETPLLPRLNRYRPLGSTAQVHFKTVKPVVATVASHINFVACDTRTWEQAATAQLEALAIGGWIQCYARNDHLEFQIPYDWYGHPRSYEPDFLVRLPDGRMFILEIKGLPHEETEAKHQAAQRWVSAVNHFGQLGMWQFHVCWDPQQLRAELQQLISSW